MAKQITLTFLGGTENKPPPGLECLAGDCGVLMALYVRDSSDPSAVVLDNSHLDVLGQSIVRNTRTAVILGTLLLGTWRNPDWEAIIEYDDEAVITGTLSDRDICSVECFCCDLGLKIQKPDPAAHDHDDRYYTEGETDALLAAKADASALSSHVADTGNPHSVTAGQVNLGNVDNTADLDKPISTATQSALDLKASDADLTTHTGNTSNPHSVTQAQVGLPNVDNTSDADKPVSTAQQAALDLKLDAADVPDELTDLDTSVTGPELDSIKTLTDFLTVTAPTDLDDIRTRVNDLDAAIVLRGTWDASTGTFPGGGTAQAGALYIVSVAGTVDGVAFETDDRLVAIVDNASTATYAANWFKRDYTDAVLSVAGLTGNITASDLRTAINVADGATANATDAALRDRSTHTGTQSLDTTTDSATRLAMTPVERTNLANQSGTNTGDQDLSGLQPKPAEGQFVDGDKTKLDNAVQPGDLGAVATSNDYGDLDNLPTLGTAAAQNVDAFATGAEGDLAASATQPGDNVSSLTNDAGYLSDINAEAVDALQDVVISAPADNEVLAFDNGSGNWINQTAAEAGLATAAQGAKADSAIQPGDIDTLAELNGVVSDATLIDTGDSRLTDSRTCDNTFDDAATARTALGLGTASLEDVGTGAGDIVQLNGSGELPAVSGVNLTDLPGGGDMLAATYDPTAVAGDAFDMDNMLEGTAKILTAAERTLIGSALQSADRLKIAIFEERQTVGTNGGTFTDGAWRQRTINTEAFDLSGIASLSVNDMVLDEGTYLFLWDAIGYNCGSHQTRLRNTSTSINYYGSSCLSYGIGNYAQDHSVGSAVVDITTTSNTFRLQHRCETTRATFGFGVAGNLGGSDNELYARVIAVRFSP